MKGVIRPCLVLNDFNGGGAERLVKDLGVELDSLADVDPVIVASKRQGELTREFETSGVELSTLDIDVIINSVVNGATTLTERLDMLDVDVVHSHLAFSDLISRFACARLSLPHLSTYHNVEGKRPLIKRIAEHATRGLSDRIICVSDGVRQSYGNDDNMCVIHNAIDVKEFNGHVAREEMTDIPDPIQSAETVFLNVGRCVDVKRQWDLIHAMELFNSNDGHLIIVGDGPLRGQLDKLVLKKGLSNQVTITGFVDSIYPYYAVADAFVSASSKEGLPTTHIEAMASKLPIISTDIPGVREVVEHGTTGYLCPVGEPRVLAANMGQLHMDECESLGIRGYEVAVAKFSIEQIAANHVALYREVA